MVVVVVVVVVMILRMDSGDLVTDLEVLIHLHDALHGGLRDDLRDVLLASLVWGRRGRSLTEPEAKVGPR